MPLLQRRPHDRPRRLEGVEEEAGDRELPHRRGEPVARDGERRHRPDRVDEGHVAARLATLTHDERRADRADAAGGEDEPERAGGGVQVVLDDVREQDLRRAQEREVRERRREQRPPEPDPPPHGLV